MRTFKDLSMKESQEVSELFAIWLKPYTHEIIVKVLEKREEILNNEFAMKLLKELAERQARERKDFNDSIWHMLRMYDDFKEFDPHNHILEHSNSYRDVLYDMYIG